MPINKTITKKELEVYLTKYNGNLLKALEVEKGFNYKVLLELRFNDDNISLWFAE